MPDQTPGWVAPAAVIAIVAGTLTVFAYWYFTLPAAGGGTTTPPATLTVSQDLGEIIGPEPDGSYDVIVGLDINGGTSPYGATLTWSDGTVQSGSGTFERDWPGYPTSLEGQVSVTSADNQTAHCSITVPYVSG